MKLTEEIEKLENKNTDLEKETKDLKEEIKNLKKKKGITKNDFYKWSLMKPIFLDKSKVMAMCMAEIKPDPEGNIIMASYSKEYLKKAIKILETLEVEDDDGLKLIFGNNYPLTLGIKRGDNFLGVCIAPRVGKDEE